VGSDLGGDLTAWLCQSVRIDMRGEYWLHVAKHAGLSGPTRPVSCVDYLHQTANAQNLHHAFHVVVQDVQRHFGADVLERFIWKCVDPIPDFIVPNGCSIVSRRWRIFSGCRIDRALHKCGASPHPPSG
jgi:hypothetical protein